MRTRFSASFCTCGGINRASFRIFPLLIVFLLCLSGLVAVHAPLQSCWNLSVSIGSKPLEEVLPFSDRWQAAAVCAPWPGGICDA